MNYPWWHIEGQEYDIFPWYQSCYPEKKTKQKTIAPFWQMGWKSHLSTDIFICVPVQSLQSFLILCNPVDCSLPGSSVYGIFEARILEWVAIPFSRGSSGPRDLTCIFCGSCIAGRFFATELLGKFIIYSYFLYFQWIQPCSYPKLCIILLHGLHLACVGSINNFLTQESNPSLLHCRLTLY